MAGTDRAKNTFKAAKLLQNLSSTSQVLSDRVGRSDPDDLYRLNLKQRSTLNLSLVGNSKAKVQLVALKGVKDKVFKAIGKIPFTELSPKQRRKYVTVLASRGANQAIQQTLEAGTYYVRIYRAQGENRYRLRYGATPITTTPIPTSTFPAPNWIRQWGTAENNYSFGSAVDASGAIYLTGVTSGSNAASGTGFVAKYNPDGSQAWQRSLQTPGTAVADIAVDSAGNYYVVGAQISGLNSDAFIAKYDSAGQQQWQKTIDSTALGLNAIDAATGIVLDGNDLYVTGVRRGVPAFLGASQGKAFIAKYTSNGDLVNGFGTAGIAEFGDAKTTVSADIAIADGKLYITGITDATLNISANSDVNLTNGDAFVAGFDRTSGNLLWNQTLSSGSNTDYARGIAVRGSELYIVGQTAGTLPSGSLPANSFAGGEGDAFVAKYTIGSTGTLQWVKQVGGSGLDAAQTVTIDAAGKIYLAGETNTSLFGPAAGGSDAWIGQVDSNGQWISAGQLGTPQNDEAYHLVAGASGLLYLSGQTQGSFPTAPSPNQGNYDVWVAQYS